MYFWVKYREETENSVILGSSVDKPQKCPKEFRKGSSKKAVCLTAQQKCLYTNAHGVGDKLFFY